jgi:hypothetical protein
MNHIKPAIAAALLLAAPMAHADCTAPGEPIAQHIKRVWRALVHPFHKHAYSHPAPAICLEPTLETVTIEAPPLRDTVVPPDALTASPGGYTTSGGYYVPLVIWEAPVPGKEIPALEPGRKEPQPVPEPAEWLVLGTGVLLVLLMTRRRRRVQP